MIYWSLQTVEVWELARKRGYLEGSAEHAMFPEHYRWMMHQMNMRLPNYTGEYPVWLWIKKPDMRSTGHFEGGTRCVRLTLDLDDFDVLVSDFERWHIVLSDGFCSDDEKEDDDFYNGKLTITKERSWERIFDLNRETDIEWTGGGRWLQGTTGRVNLDQVKKVEYFTTRKSRYETVLKASDEPPCFGQTREKQAMEDAHESRNVSRSKKGGSEGCPGSRA